MQGYFFAQRNFLDRGDVCKSFQKPLSPLKGIRMKAKNKNNSFLIALGPSKTKLTELNEAVGPRPGKPI